MQNGPPQSSLGGSGGVRCQRALSQSAGPAGPRAAQTRGPVGRRGATPGGPAHISWCKAALGVKSAHWGLGSQPRVAGGRAGDWTPGEGAPGQWHCLQHWVPARASELATHRLGQVALQPPLPRVGEESLWSKDLRCAELGSEQAQFLPRSRLPSSEGPLQGKEETGPELTASRAQGASMRSGSRPRTRLA